MSATNPFLLPGNNPTGNTLTVPFGSPVSLSGGNPMMPQVPSGVTSTVNNPYSGGVSTPTNSSNTALTTSGITFGADQSPYGAPVVPGGGSPTVPPNNPTAGSVGVNSISQSLGAPSTTQGQHQVWSGLAKTYGAGFATALQNFLNSGAGFNQDAINNLLAALQPGFNQDQQNLLQNFSSSGNRFSSGAEIGESNLMSQENLDVGQIETQMYEDAVNNYIGVLTGTAGQTASRIQNQTSGLDQMLSSAASSAASLASTLA
jgi:hypothetical protein